MGLLKKTLDSLATVFTIFLVVYGFTKGYDVVEFVIYDIYFVVVIISQILTLSGREEL